MRSIIRLNSARSHIVASIQILLTCCTYVDVNGVERPFYRLMGSADREKCKILSQLCLSRCICSLGRERSSLKSVILILCIVSCLLVCSNSFCFSAQPCYVYAIVGYRPTTRRSYLTRRFTIVLRRCCCDRCRRLSAVLSIHIANYFETSMWILLALVYKLHVRNCVCYTYSKKYSVLIGNWLHITNLQ